VNSNLYFDIVDIIYYSIKSENWFDKFRGSTIIKFPQVRSTIGLSIPNLHYLSAIEMIEIDIPFYFALLPI